MVAVAIVYEQSIDAILSFAQEEIGIAIIVTVAPGHSESDPWLSSRDAVGQPGEGAVAVVVIQIIGSKPVRGEQIKISIVIKIRPSAAQSRGVIGDNAIRYLRKCSVPIIVVEEVLASRIGDKQVWIAIVIVITPRGPLPRRCLGDNGPVRHRPKVSATFVMIKQIRLVHAGDKQIEQSIIVVITP